MNIPIKYNTTIISLCALAGNPKPTTELVKLLAGPQGLLAGFSEYGIRECNPIGFCSGSGNCCPTPLHASPGIINQFGFISGNMVH